MTVQQIFKDANYLKHIGYAKSIDKLSDKKIVNFYQQLDPTIDVLKRKFLHKELDLDPAQTIMLINHVISNNICATGKEHTTTHSLAEKIALIHGYNVQVMSPYNFIFQDVIDVITTGERKDFKKYAYTLEREFVLTTFNHNNYNVLLNVEIPKDKPLVNMRDSILIKTLGIEQTVYLLLLLVYAGYYNGEIRSLRND